MSSSARASVPACVTFGLYNGYVEAREIRPADAREVVEHADPRALLGQVRNEVRPDEAAAAGNEDVVANDDSLYVPRRAAHRPAAPAGARP